MPWLSQYVVQKTDSSTVQFFISYSVCVYLAICYVKTRRKTQGKHFTTYFMISNNNNWHPSKHKSNATCIDNSKKTK